APPDGRRGRRATRAEEGRRRGARRRGRPRRPPLARDAEAPPGPRPGLAGALPQPLPRLREPARRALPASVLALGQPTRDERGRGGVVDDRRVPEPLLGDRRVLMLAEQGLQRARRLEEAVSLARGGELRRVAGALDGDPQGVQLLVGRVVAEPPNGGDEPAEL